MTNPLRRAQRKPTGLDLVGYETLIQFIRQRGLHRLDGDLVEIGAFMGGGTAKLARFARGHGKRVYAIDIFDPDADETPAEDGTRMCEIYNAFLEGRPQLLAYRDAVRGLGNVVTLHADSRTVSFPQGTRFAFGFVDGNHRREYVRSDFLLVWTRLVPGGAVGLHDYDGGLPEVTRCIDELLAERSDQIREAVCVPEKHIIFVVKREGGQPS